MEAEATRVLVKRLYDEVLNDGRVEALEEIAAEDYDEHDPLPGQGTGREGLRERVEMLRAALGQTFTVEDVIAQGDRVAVRWTGTGSHRGEFFGIPPTNRPFTISGIDIYRTEEGRLAEHWHVVDQLALLVQLGIIELPGPPA